jgi:hypothetical protein
MSFALTYLSLEAIDGSLALTRHRKHLDRQASRNALPSPNVQVQFKLQLARVVADQRPGPAVRTRIAATSTRLDSASLSKIRTLL